MTKILSQQALDSSWPVVQLEFELEQLREQNTMLDKRCAEYEQIITALRQSIP